MYFKPSNYIYVHFPDRLSYILKLHYESQTTLYLDSIKQKTFMNNTLLYLLSQEELDVTAIVKLITFGKPKKFWGFNTGGYEPVNLFDRESGETAFHLLARKGKLSDVLPTLFDNAETILAREGIVVPRSLGMSLEASAQAVIFTS
jgi:hypothetical protein